MNFNEAMRTARSFCDFPSGLSTYQSLVEKNFLNDLLHTNEGWTFDEAHLFASWWRENIRSKTYGNTQITWSLNINEGEVPIGFFHVRKSSG